MVGRVFISCGQRPPREKNIAEKVGKLLKEKFDLDCYLAFKVQSFSDIMKIIDELKKSDYYLFIDFLRKRSDDNFDCSLFTHQELALAYSLGFNDFIAFREEGLNPEGFLRYILAHPETFRDEKDLIQKVEAAVNERKWNKDYSRNLVLAGVEAIGPALYTDHFGTHTEYIWHAKIENRRPDAAAVNAVCVLESIGQPDGKIVESKNTSYLKWVGLKEGYQTTILPKAARAFDAFAIHADEGGIYLHSALDLAPREPIVRNEGIYKFYYKIFSEGFPLFSFNIEVSYKHSFPTPSQWTNLTKTQVH